MSRSASPLTMIAGFVAVMGYLFWPEFSTGFQRVSGDTYDGLLAIAIHEHWWNALRGFEPVTKVPWFHPWPNTLAYNDGYLMHGLLYAAGRAAGLDPIVAAALVQVLLKAVGYVALLLIGQRFLGLPAAPAVLAAMLGTALPSMVQELPHAQFAAMGPGLLNVWLGMEAARALLAGRRPVGLALTAGAAVLYGALLLTSFYVAWGLGLVALLATLLLILGAPRRALAMLRPAPVSPWAGVATLAVVVGLLVLAVVPGLLLYLPAVKQSGLHQVGMVKIHSGGYGTLISVGPNSLLWGWMDPVLTLRGRAFFNNGFAPGLLVLSLVGIVLALCRTLQGDDRARLIAAIAGSALILSLLCFNWDRTWPWAAVWNLVPGARAFRVPPRIMLIAGPALALLAGWVVWRLGRRSGALGFALAALLLLDAWRGPLHLLDVPAEMARLRAIPAPPAACTVFAATRPREGVPANELAANFSHNVDAMLTSAWLNLPTVNGISTLLPPGLDLAHPERPDYADRVLGVAEQHGLSGGLCGLDLQALRWAPPGWAFAAAEAEEDSRAPSLPLLTPGVPLPFTKDRPDIASALLRGWAEPEGWGIWATGLEARLLLRLPEGWSGSGRLAVTGATYTGSASGTRLIRLSTARDVMTAPWTEAQIAAEPEVVEVPFTGTVNLAGCPLARAAHHQVVGWDDCPRRLPQLRRVSLPSRDHQPSGVALLSLPAQLADGGGDAGFPRHRGQSRNTAPVGPQVRPGVRQSDPPPAAPRR